MVKQQNGETMGSTPTNENRLTPGVVFIYKGAISQVFCLFFFNLGFHWYIRGKFEFQFLAIFYIDVE